jgi:glycopeptidolipid biosynthesis protein
MELTEKKLPLTRRQLDIWLAQETGYTGTEFQLGLLVKIAGAIEAEPLRRAIHQAVLEAEPGRAAFFEVDGQVFQEVVDYPHVELALYDLRGSHDPVSAVRETASIIQRTPMPFTGPLFKFALLQTQPDEFYLFASCHHIAVDGLGMALVSRRVATIYSAMVSGHPIPPAYFRPLRDLIAYESEYEASAEYLEDQDFWRSNLPQESGPDYKLPQASLGQDPYSPTAPVLLDASVVSGVKTFARAHHIRWFSVVTAACALLVHRWCANGSEVALELPGK